jgi:hypothetical protein
MVGALSDAELRPRTAVTNVARQIWRDNTEMLAQVSVSCPPIKVGRHANAMK